MPHDEGQETQPAGSPRGGGPPGPGDLPDLPWVRLTQRHGPPRDRRRVWAVLAAVVAGHVLLGWLAFLLLRPVARPAGGGGAISVMLFEPSTGIPPPPPLAAPPPPLEGPPAAPPPHREAPARGAIQAELEGVQGPSLELYRRDGQVRVPAAGGQGQPAPAYTARLPQGSTGLTVDNPVPYKPTRFNRDWAPDDQTLGGKLLDRAIDKTTIEKTVHLPGGGRIKCAVNPLLALAGGLLGCSGTPPAPPPRNDDDIRLSMPPAQSLTGKPVAVPGAGSSSAAPASAGSAPGR